MVFYGKLFLSLSAFLLGLTLVQRVRPGRFPPVVGAGGVAAAWVAVLVLAVGMLALHLPLRPGVWVLSAAGGAQRAQNVLAIHGGLAGLVLLLLSARIVLEGFRHPWARLLESPLVVAWLVLWVLAMFGWI